MVTGVAHKTIISRYKDPNESDQTMGGWADVVFEILADEGHVPFYSKLLDLQPKQNMPLIENKRVVTPDCFIWRKINEFKATGVICWQRLLNYYTVVRDLWLLGQ